ncbi:hypothetical protein Pmani_007852 [Petrolisthes manimaculis]|uniref:4-coumarate--CoA ligase n=1 Tax=Petrolisthes manimaculis TaxID=1843537 RepID=A0AAE1UF88_9EUCA|nr:hypothetical protein Pmani_007852 [Petrolisthes manimaculis]
MLCVSLCRPWFSSCITHVARRQLGSSSAVQQVISSEFEINTPKGNVATYILQNASQWSKHTAVECSVTGRSYTYSQLVDQVAKFGGVLQKMGIGPGDRVGVMMLNCLEYPIVFLGTLFIGAVPAVYNSSYTAEEVSKQLVDSGAKLVVGDEACWGALSVALRQMSRPAIPTILNFHSSPLPQGHPKLSQLLEDQNIPFADAVEVDETELAFIPYSSGTTGNPKGVKLSHGALSSSLEMLAHPSVSLIRQTSGNEQDSCLCYLPFFHIYGINFHLANAIKHGGRVVVVPKFDPSTYVSNLFKYKVRVIHTVPTVLNFLMQSPQVGPDTMTHVEAVLCGAAPVSHTAASSLAKKMDKHIQFVEGYGMTEVMITHMTPLGEDKVGSCGKCLPSVSTKIIDLQDGRLLGPNEQGELYIKTPSIMSGYDNNDKATQDTITEDGWVKSGDIGFYDEDGFFSVIDRSKELIKVKALQVAPSELEEVLLQHPKVVEAGVVGVPDERLGEAPRAYVVTSNPTTPNEIKEFVDTRVAPYKRLVGGVVFINEMPKNQTGKMLRKELRKMALSSL